MLTDSPVVRSAGPRILFVVGAIVTIAILLGIQQLRLNGGPPRGMTPIFYFLFTSGDYGGTVCMFLIMVLALFAPMQSPARGILRWVGEHPVIIATISLIVLCGGAVAVYHKHPLSMDEYAAYFQSQVFAAGHLTGQFPLPLMDWLIPPRFQDYFLSVSHASGHVASAYWPAHALIMAPFTLAGISWACNPVISALTLLVIHRLALRIFEDTEAAGLALLLTVASPAFFGFGISYYIDALSPPRQLPLRAAADSADAVQGLCGGNRGFDRAHAAQSSAPHAVRGTLAGLDRCASGRHPAPRPTVRGLLACLHPAGRRLV